jgi:hypothetical protein
MHVAGTHVHGEARPDLTTAARPLDPLLPARLPRETWTHRLFTGIGTTLDGTVMRAMQLVVERALIPDESQVDALRESAAPLLAPALQEDPRRFFGFLDDDPQPLRLSWNPRRRLEGGVARDCRIESDYLPLLQRADAADPTPIHVELWEHEARQPRGTVVALHGFTMGRPRIDAVVLMANQWYERGLDVALVTLPYHGARTPSDARFSGEHFAVPDVSRLSEAVREAVYEVRRVVHWRREETGAPVGLLGLSLGGYLAALMAGLCDDLDFVVPIVPPVCIGDLAWGFFKNTQHYRSGGPAAISQDELRRAFRVHSPLAHPLRIPRERVLIVAGRGDRVVPPEHPATLCRHWGAPDIHWFSGSHLAPFGRGRVVRTISRHLRGLRIL